MKLRKLIKKIKRPIIVFVGLAFIYYVLNEHIFPFLVNKKLLDILKKIDLIYYILILCLANIGFSIYLLLKFNKKLSASSRDKMYIGFSRVEKEELEILKEEHKAILEHLIKQENYGAYRNKLLESYELQYPDKSELEFGINLKEMQRLGYITQQETQWGLAVRITDRASEILAKLNQWQLGE